jgi:hypothetical protein
MKLTILTTSLDILSNLFWTTYILNNGINPTNIVVLKSREDLKFGLIEKLLILIRSWSFLSILDILKLRYNVYNSNYNVLFKNSNIFYENNLDNISIYTSNVTHFISVGCPYIIKKEILEKHKDIKFVNLHNGNINKLRGHFSTFWEYYYKFTKSSVTLHEINDKVDDGKILILYENNRYLFNLYQMMIHKKIIGGYILAQFTNGNYVKPPKCKNIESKYKGWPRKIDILKL